MALCRIASRSSSLALRAAQPGFLITTAKEQAPILVNGARRQFWSFPEYKLIKNNLIDILDTKIKTAEESKKELVHRPSSFPFTIKHVEKRVQLERKFNLKEDIEISVKRKNGSTGCEEHLELVVTISRPCDDNGDSEDEDLVLKVDLKASADILEITKLRIGSHYSGFRKAGELDQDLRHSMMKYLRILLDEVYESGSPDRSQGSRFVLDDQTQEIHQ